MELKVGVKSDKGKVRRKNEDTYYIDPKAGLFIVADGLGGHPAGEVASKMAVEDIVFFLKKQAEPGEELLREAVRSANAHIYEESLRDARRRGMGTTAVVALIRDGDLWLAHVGDSRAYMVTEAGLVQLTTDHSLYSAGPLLRAVGIDSDVEVDTRNIRCLGESVMLCTDGLTNMLTRKEMERILRSDPEPQRACDRLVDASNFKGGVDNITVMIIKKGEKT